MSKELTEKWKNSELPEDCYYILDKNGHIRKERTCYYSHTEEQCFCFMSNKDIEEVIEPVPSYDEYKELTQKVGRLELDSEAQDQVITHLQDENKKLKEQIDEANELIKIATPLFGFGSEKADAELSNFKRYLIRWGVK